MKKHHIVPVLLLVAAVIGCKQLSGIAGGGKGKGTATGGSDPKTDVVEASKKFLTIPSYTAHMQGSGTQADTKSVLKYLQPDKFHMITEGGPGAGMETMAIGDMLYMKVGGNWSKMPGDAKAIGSSRLAFSEEGLKTYSDISYEGSERVDGSDAEIYKYKAKTPIGDFGYGCRMWIIADKGVPAKLVCDYDNGTLKQMTITYDYTTPVNIEAPVK